MKTCLSLLSSNFVLWIISNSWTFKLSYFFSDLWDLTWDITSGIWKQRTLHSTKKRKALLSGNCCLLANLVSIKLSMTMSYLPRQESNIAIWGVTDESINNQEYLCINNRFLSFPGQPMHVKRGAMSLNKLSNWFSQVFYGMQQKNNSLVGLQKFICGPGN